MQHTSYYFIFYAVITTVIAVNMIWIDYLRRESVEHKAYRKNHIKRRK